MAASIISKSWNPWLRLTLLTLALTLSTRETSDNGHLCQGAISVPCDIFKSSSGQTCLNEVDVNEILIYKDGRIFNTRLKEIAKRLVFLYKNQYDKFGRKKHMLECTLKVRILLKIRRLNERSSGIRLIPCVLPVVKEIHVFLFSFLLWESKTPVLRFLDFKTIKTSLEP